MEDHFPLQGFTLTWVLTDVEEHFPLQGFTLTRILTDLRKEQTQSAPAPPQLFRLFSKCYHSGQGVHTI